MRILIVSHTFPYPPNEGIKLPLYNLIKEFSKNNEVSLISFIFEKEKIFIDEVKKYCKELEIIFFKPSKNILKIFYNIFFESTPYNVKQFFSLEFKEKLLSLTKKIDFDIIFFDFLTTAIYSDFIIDKRFVKFLHYHDAMSMLFYRNFFSDKNILRKVYWYFQYRKILSFENKFNNMFDKITVVAEKDKQWLVSKSKIEENKVEVIPNGVDIEYFKVFKEEILKYKKELKIFSPSILFRGIMNFRPNIDGCLWFLKKVFPILKKLIPEIKFYIVGPNPSNEILRYKIEDVIIKGYVEDLRFYIASCDINICPMISGSGIKNKILESLAMGKPSVITSIACEGIPELKDGENVLIADTPQEFADKIILLFKNNDLYQKIAYNGRKLVEKNYTWEKAVKKFYKLFEELSRGDSTL
ncbi:MAG: glycosyltransferase family 4 protein [Candidatus Omnitrophica bacterium]|nr:glycosyltransferase family 4 protein [Candidatus Omnitrophota bacterium]